MCILRFKNQMHFLFKQVYFLFLRYFSIHLYLFQSLSSKSYSLQCTDLSSLQLNLLLRTLLSLMLLRLGLFYFFFSYFILFYFIFCLFAISWATPTACGDSQARGQIGAIATGLHQSHGNSGSEPRLQTTPQLTAKPDP